MSWTRAAVGVVAMAVAAGCCPRPVGVLMPPLGSSEQVARVNARAGIIETVRATGRVTIVWVDKDNHEHRESAEGSLVFRKRSAKVPGVGVLGGGGASGPSVVYYDAMLFGRVAGQDVFELGENETNYWMAVRVDPKTADVAKKKWAAEPVDAFDPAAAFIPLRAGTIPVLLGLAPVQAEAFATVVMTNPAAVEIVTLSPQYRLAPYTVLEVSRYEPGDPSKVRLYRPDGVVEGEAVLSEYKEVVTFKPGGDPGDAPEKGPAVRLPFKLHVEYPTRKTSVDLEISAYEVNLPRKVVYTMPDWVKQGLKPNEIFRGN